MVRGEAITGDAVWGKRTADAAVADTLSKFNYGVENIHDDVNGAEGSRTRELMRSSDELALWWHNQIMVAGPDSCIPVLAAT